ncbi:uncharacterized protein LOC118248789 [Cygnus atratus]|uniref:uncharacterized protein LOC118248789 n=1 Tax=Cygnus atratus TaxID=8868 RepID=UPI0015D58876|nr:uncharacterized protein LOC118248789 [Cygnus atratus]
MQGFNKSSEYLRTPAIGEPEKVLCCLQSRQCCRSSPCMSLHHSCLPTAWSRASVYLCNKNTHWQSISENLLCSVTTRGWHQVQCRWVRPVRVQHVEWMYTTWGSTVAVCRDLACLPDCENQSPALSLLHASVEPRPSPPRFCPLLLILLVSCHHRKESGSFFSTPPDHHQRVSTCRAYLCNGILYCPGVLPEEDDHGSLKVQRFGHQYSSRRQHQILFFYTSNITEMTLFTWVKCNK